MIRQATAVWRGGPGAGEGTVSTSSGVIRNVLYSFGSTTGTGNDPCTSPCEMLAASAAACMSMMIAQETARQRLHPQDISTTATLKLEELEEGWTVTEIHLDVAVRIREADPAAFQKALEAARKKCSVSRALKCNITVSTRLEPAIASAVI